MIFGAALFGQFCLKCLWLSVHLFHENPTMPPRFVQTINLLLVSLAAVLLGSNLLGSSFASSARPAIAHVLKDGYIERTVEVVIRDDTAYVEYSVGLNENTMAQLTSSWELKTQPTESKPSGGNEDEKANPKESEPVETTKTKTDKKPSDSKPVDSKPVDSKPVDSNPDDSSPTDSSSTDSSSEKATVFDKALLAKFNKSAPAKVTEGLKITCDDKPVKIESVALDPAPRHPFDVKVKFQFKIPKSDKESIELKLEDSNFTKQTGAVRYALKAKGIAMLLQSNVAPIIVRAERVELGELTEEQRKTQTSILARIAFMKKLKK